jgi:hypothetical protein
VVFASLGHIGEGRGPNRFHKAAMVTTSNDKGLSQLYASSEEVEALRVKVETFMQQQQDHNKSQEVHNATISSTLEKLLKLAEESGAKISANNPEDKGSSVKSKDTTPCYTIPQLRRPEFIQGDTHTHRKVNFAPSTSHTAPRPMLQLVPYHSTSQDGQYEEDEITEFDDGDEYF